MIAHLRRWLIAGVVALAPLLVTVVVVNWLLELSAHALALLPPHWRPEHWIGFEIPGLGVAMALAFIMLVGAVTSHFLGSSLIHWMDRIMERIPLVRSLHKATRQLLAALFSDTSRAFQEVVLVQFPNRGRWVLGFVTGEGRLPAAAGGEGFVSVFVPSTPIPTTGWLMFVDASELVHLDMTVEEGMKMLLSGGVLTPGGEGDALSGGQGGVASPPPAARPERGSPVKEADGT
ncbi:MAG: DUF502 domain-containing protein [Mariprofundaceae bacterium]